MNAEEIEKYRNELITHRDTIDDPAAGDQDAIETAQIWLAACYLSRALFRHNLFGHAATQRLAHESRARKYLQQ